MLTAGPVLPILLLAVTDLLVVVDGIPQPQNSTPTHMVIQLPVVAMFLLLAVLEMDSGEMANTLPVLPILVSSVSSLVFKMIQQNSRPVSTSRSTTIFPSRLLVMMFPSHAPNSPTHLWTIICCATLNSLTTRPQHQFKSTPFLLSWVVVI